MSATLRLYNTSSVADRLGTSPASIHSYMHHRAAGADSRYANVPVPTHLIEGKVGQGTPVWTEDEMNRWAEWHTWFLAHRYSNARAAESNTDD